MTYGFKSFNSAGEVLLNSDINGLSGLRIRASGTGASASVVPTFDPAQDFLFIEAASTSNTAVAVIPDFVTSPGTPIFRQTFGTGTVSVNWAIVERFVDAGLESPQGYGIQVYDAAGDLQFNSDSYDGEGGVGLVDIIPENAVIGKPYDDGYQNRLGARGKYIEVSWGVWGNGNGYRGVVFYNNYTSNGVMYNRPGSINDTPDGAFYIASYQGGIYESRTNPLLNSSPILVADIGGSV